jgi:glutathionylspermidine synthase
VDALEAAANALHYLCIDAAEAVIKNEWWPRLGIPELAIPQHSRRLGARRLQPLRTV